MQFTDIFIKRPVLSSVVSLLILMIGLVSFYSLPVQKYPTITSTVITITTPYTGATPETVQNFVTTPISQAVGSADGIDYMMASSRAGLSTITIYVKLNFDPNDAFTNVSAKVNTVLNILPPGALTPTVTVESGDTFPILFLGFTNPQMDSKQITAYVNNVLKPKVYSVGGISSIGIFGADTYAMRIWLDPARMASLKVTPTEVFSALADNNVQAAPGQLEGEYDLINLQAYTDTTEVSQFENLVVKEVDGSLIRIKDIANVELGSQTYTQSVTFNNQRGVFLTVTTAPSANPLTVVDGIFTLLPTLEKGFPPGMQVATAYDGTTFVRESISEVTKTIKEAAIIVMIVIFIFLGAFRAVLIPLVTIPLSLIGVCTLMAAMGFSINLLTLLAVVLAIGLVVDDAIVVLENIYRHIEAGETPFDAAIKGAREIAMPVVVMTLTLAAVYAPIGFTSGVTGALFREFAFTLAAAVVISGIIALTFSPMLCSKLINVNVLHSPIAKRIDAIFNRLQAGYFTLLKYTLKVRYLVLGLAFMILALCYYLFTALPTQLAPQEDTGSLKIINTAPVNANLAYLEKFTPEFYKAFDSIPEKKNSFLVNGFPNTSTVLASVALTPWGERTRTAMQIAPELQQKMNAMTGFDAKVIQDPSLPGTPLGPPINFILTSSNSQITMNPFMEEIIKQARSSGLFAFASNVLQINNPQYDIHIDRDKAAMLGINMQDIATALSVMTGSGYVNYYNQYGYNFQVIPQIMDNLRTNKETLNQIYIPTQNKALIPLASLIDMTESVQPSQLNQFQQLNAVIMLGAPAAGVTMGQAVAFLSQTAESILPGEISYDFGAAARQYVEEGSTILIAFALAIIIVYLLLAAQFESFRDPLVILFSVPMSMFGALLPLYLTGASMNIYTQVGLVTLVGLITKHGILMIEFANHLQHTEKLDLYTAIEKAASIRLRPILMTTAAMVFGVIPLVIATGAGAVSRNNIGMVIAYGMGIGTLFTLFVIPVMYTFISKPKN